MKAARPKRTRLRGQGKSAGLVLSDARLKEAVSAIGYHFKDTSLLVQALTHPSAAPAGNSVKHSNQRLEFLGDRVLNLVIADRLITRRQNESEGDLAPKLNRLVKKGACAQAMRDTALGGFILLSPSEESNGGRDRESTLGDACEAIIGAIYLDGGLNAARKFIERAWTPQFQQAPSEVKDPKTLLQELTQSEGLGLPVYAIISRTGPDHDPVFEVEVRLSDDVVDVATGGSKREAERMAAAKLLARLRQDT